MQLSRTIMALAGLACVVSVPAAADEGVATATEVRKLDMMLMVTSLRCRFGANDFRPEYQQLRARHQGEIRAANQRVLRHLTSQMGRRAAINTYDRMSTGMANRYGRGHPRLNCAALKQEVGTLANSAEQMTLREVASDLLAVEPPMTSQSTSTPASL